MLTKDFTYILPEELIARYPVPNRSDSRLLGLNRDTGNIADYKFADIASLLRPGDLLVVNDTKVMPARLLGHKETGGKIEVLIERILDKQQAWVQVRASKSPKPGTYLVFADGLRALVRKLDYERSMVLIVFETDDSILKILERHGRIPLPPYMARNPELDDADRYQTVYANPPGSVAAPTAGLHFDQKLLTQIQLQGVDLGYVTLHVGAGTFQPVRVQNIADHKMHAEYMQVSKKLCEQIVATKKRNGRVVCVGTTSVRALESAAASGNLEAKTGDTEIFIRPGYNFKVVDALLTNFHLPESTLIMLVSAFAGKEKVFNAYKHAIANKYRFYSYGDAMFIAS